MCAESDAAVDVVELMPIVVVLVIIGTVGWVDTDARTRAEGGASVVFSVGSIRVDVALQMLAEPGARVESGRDCHRVPPQVVCVRTAS